MERHTAIIESIRAHRQIYSVDCEHAEAVVAFHRSPAGRKTNVGPVNFHKPRRRPPRQPSKEIHHPLTAISSVPSRAAAFIVTKQRFGSWSDRDLLIITFRFRPTHRPARAGHGLVRPVPSLHAYFNKEHPDH